MVCYRWDGADRREEAKRGARDRRDMEVRMQEAEKRPRDRKRIGTQERTKREWEAREIERGK